MNKRILYLFGAILMLSGSAGGYSVTSDSSCWPGEIQKLLNGDPIGSSKLFFWCQMAVGLGFMHVATARAVRTSYIARRGRILHGMAGWILLISGGLLLFGGIELTQWLRSPNGWVTPNSWVVVAGKVGLCGASVFAVLCGWLGFKSCRRVDYFSNPQWKNTLVFFGGYLCVAGLICWSLLTSAAARRAALMLRQPESTMPAFINPAQAASAIQMIIYSGIAQAFFCILVAIFLILAAILSPGRPVPESYADMH